MLVGVDVGGTFTDFVVADESGVRTHKVPSSRADPGGVVRAGMRALGGTSMAHGTTVATNASKPGILAGTSAIIAEAGIPVRQVIVDDPEIMEDPRALLITEKPVPERLLPRIRNLEGVRGVVLR